MRLLLVGALLCLCSKFVYAQNELAFEPGTIYLKSGDSLQCFVELAVAYNKKVSYKEKKEGPTEQLESSRIRGIKTPYKYVENLMLDGKERLMSQAVAGELRLFNHVTINKGQEKPGYGGTYSMNNAPTIVYALQNDSTVAEVTKRNFESVASTFMRLEQGLVAKIKSNNYKIENLEELVSEYNNLRHIKRVTRKVTGRVVDTETKKGIKEASVSIQGMDSNIKTNALGYFQLDVLPWDTLHIIHSEYEPVQVAIPDAPAFLIPVAKITQSEKDTSPETDKVLNKDEPHFNGGYDAMMAFIRAHIKYPVQARRRGDQGTVWVKFIVDKDGSLTHLEIADGISRELDQEAFRIVSLMPPWIPAEKNNIPIAAEFKLPIKFKLN